MLQMRHLHRVRPLLPALPGHFYSKAREGGYDVRGDYCKGCGVCASACPRTRYWHGRWPMRQLISGNYAVAEAVRLAKVQFVAAYPITPQTPIYEKLSDMENEGSSPA